jgi:hypothetical protein
VHGARWVALPNSGPKSIKRLLKIVENFEVVGALTAVCINGATGLLSTKYIGICPKLQVATKLALGLNALVHNFAVLF